MVQLRVAAGFSSIPSGRPDRRIGWAMAQPLPSSIGGRSEKVTPRRLSRARQASSASGIGETSGRVVMGKPKTAARSTGGGVAALR
jgi:hypothetical protein